MIFKRKCDKCSHYRLLFKTIGTLKHTTKEGEIVNVQYAGFLHKCTFYNQEIKPNQTCIVYNFPTAKHPMEKTIFEV